MSIRLFYDRWPQYHRRLLDAVPTWTEEQLALRASPAHMADLGDRRPHGRDARVLAVPRGR